MKYSYLFAMIILFLFLFGCSPNNLNLKIMSISEITDRKDFTKVEYEIIYNSDLTITSCNFMFVNEEGIEYKITDIITRMTYQHCEGIHMAGSKQKFISYFDPKIKDMPGTFYVNLWSNELSAGTYKRYSAFDKLN